MNKPLAFRLQRVVDGGSGQVMAVLISLAVMDTSTGLAYAVSPVLDSGSEVLVIPTSAAPCAMNPAWPIGAPTNSGDHDDLDYAVGELCSEKVSAPLGFETGERVTVTFYGVTNYGFRMVPPAAFGGIAGIIPGTHQGVNLISQLLAGVDASHNGFSVDLARPGYDSFIVGHVTNARSASVPFRVTQWFCVDVAGVKVDGKSMPLTPETSEFIIDTGTSSVMLPAAWKPKSPPTKGLVNLSFDLGGITLKGSVPVEEVLFNEREPYIIGLSCLLGRTLGFDLAASRLHVT